MMSAVSKESEDESEAAGTSSMMESTMMEGEEYYNPETTVAWTEKVPGAEQLCRICANTNEYLIPIFSGEGLEHQLGMKIEKHLPIQVVEEDKLPLHVCYQCASTLIAWHDLVIGCVEAEKKLRQVYQQRNEEEEEDGYADDDKTDFFDEPVDNEIAEDPLKPSTSASATTRSTRTPRKKTVTRAKPKLKMTLVKTPPAILPKSSSKLLQPKEEQVEPDAATERYQDEILLSPSESDDNLSGVDKSNVPIVPTTVVYFKCVAANSEDDLVNGQFSRSKFMCATCSKVYVHKSDLLLHVTTHPLAATQCRLCDKTFGNDMMLKSHMIQHLGDYPYKCSLCTDGFVFKVSLVKHRRNVHHIIDSNFKCVSCGKLFVSRERLRQHKSRAHSATEGQGGPSCKQAKKKSARKRWNDRLLCSLCGLSFTRSYLANHVKAVHNIGPTKYTCKQCGEEFHLDKKYKLHLLHHEGKRDYVCDLCGVSFFKRSQLMSHLRSHAERSHACNMCFATFKGSADLKRHVAVVHMGIRKKPLKTYQCEVCNKQFSSSSRLGEHAALHAERVYYPCVCGKTYTSKRRLEEHRRSEHRTGDHPCQQCDRIFHTPQGLNRHISAAHAGNGSEVTPKHSSCAAQKRVRVAIRCETCGETCVDVRTLRHHMRDIHNAALLFVCKEQNCTKSYASAPSLYQHTRNAHSGNTSKSYPCKICGKSLTTSYSRNAHMSIHTGELKHECNVCKKSFRLACSLTMHLMTHTDVKPVSCSVCDKRFRKKSHLVVHMRTHTGEKPYTCDICGRGFAQVGDRNKHRQSIHKSTPLPVDCCSDSHSA